MGRPHLLRGLREGAGPGAWLTPCSLQVTQCYFEGGYQETPVYLLGELGYGHQLQGPCLIIDSNRWAETWPGWSLGEVNCRALGRVLKPMSCRGLGDLGVP